MIKKFFLFFTLIFSYLRLVKPSLAICPVCTVAVGAGFGLSRWLRVDDLVSGVWIGGLISSGALWFLDWLEKRNRQALLRKLIFFLLSYIIIIFPLFWSGVIGHPLNKFCGIDKVFLGIFLGNLAFFIGFGLNQFLKNKNSGKAFFPFQKVILPISSILITSVILYIILKCQ